MSDVVAENQRANSEANPQVVHGGSSPGASNHRTLITTSAILKNKILLVTAILSLELQKN